MFKKKKKIKIDLLSLLTPVYKKFLWTKHEVKVTLASGKSKKHFQQKKKQMAVDLHN